MTADRHVEHGVSAKARAKINLDLRVLDRAVDGYHHIETLFARIALHDSIKISAVGTGQPAKGGSSDGAPTDEAPDDGIELVVTGDSGGADGPSNLAYRAAAALRAQALTTTPADAVPAVRIELTKRIPVGAGLGGGSSDAGTTLRALNEFWGHPVAESDLVALASAIGADVAFFVSDCAAAWGTGRGDRLLATELPSGASVLLALPPVHVDTAGAYARLAEGRTDSTWPGGRVTRDADTASWEALFRQCQNDFEAPVHDWLPDLGELHRSLAGTEAQLVRMSGSGSAHFGLYRTEGEAHRAREELSPVHPSVRFEVTHFE